MMITITCQAQVNGNFKSVRLVGADSTQGTLNGTMYYGTNGFRFREAGVWYKLYKPALFSSTLNGLVPASGGGTTNFLRADGTWAASTGTNLSYTAATRTLNSSTGTGVVLPLFNSTAAGLTPLSGGGTTNFLRADGSWASPTGTFSGSLASTQVAFGSGVNTITGDADFLYDALTNGISVNTILPTSGGLNISSPSTTSIGATTNLQLIAGGNLLINPDGSIAIEAATNQNIDITGSSGTSQVNILGSGGSSIGEYSGASGVTFSSGTVNITSGSTTRLQIESDGSWNVSGSNGTSGQALVSNGSGSTPTWQTVGSGNLSGSLTSGRVPFASGTSTLTDDADLTFSGSTLTVTNISSGTLSITQGQIISGSYTPTITPGTNVSSTTPSTAYYVRVGDNVTVHGQITVNLTSPSAAFGLTISLPVGTSNNGAGSGSFQGSSFYHISIIPAVNAVQVDCPVVASSGSGTLTYIFQYKI